MAFVISAAVGFIGAAVGTAIGTAIGGTILGISAATIGGVIGAGLAGGVLSMARGGSFGKGFLMGAAGGAIGGILKGSFDGFLGSAAEGATGATGDTVEGMLAAQGGADFAPTALEGSVGSATGAAATDLAGGATTYGLGDTTASAGTTLEGTSGIPSAGTDLATSATQGPYGTTPAFSLQSQFGDYSGDASAFNQPSGLQGLGTSGSTAPDVSTYSGSSTPMTASSLESAAYGNTPSASTTPTLDNVSSPQATDTGAAPPLNTTVTSDGGNPSSGGLSGMWDTAKSAWNENMPSGSLAKTLMGGADYLQKSYESHKLDRINKGMKPLTFDEWKTQYAPGQEAQYRAASNQMARSGHTGTLPILMANMNKEAQAGYSKYLPQAQQTNLANTAALSNMKQGNRSALIRPLSELNWGNS